MASKQQHRCLQTPTLCLVPAASTIPPGHGCSAADTEMPSGVTIGGRQAALFSSCWQRRNLAQEAIDQIESRIIPCWR